MSARSRRGRPLALLRSSWHCGRALDPRSRVLVPLFSITHSRSATATLSTAPCCQCPSARHLADHLWHLRFLPFLLPLTCPRPPAYTEPQRHVNGGKVRLCSACKLVLAPAIRTETPERVADALHPPPTAYPRHCRSLSKPADPLRCEKPAAVWDLSLPDAKACVPHAADRKVPSGARLPKIHGPTFPVLNTSHKSHTSTSTSLPNNSSRHEAISLSRGYCWQIEVPRPHFYHTIPSRLLDSDDKNHAGAYNTVQRSDQRATLSYYQVLGDTHAHAAAIDSWI